MNAKNVIALFLVVTVLVVASLACRVDPFETVGQQATRLSSTNQAQATQIYFAVRETLTERAKATQTLTPEP